MQLSEIRDDVRTYLINRDDITDAQIDSWINDAVRQIQRANNFEWMATSATIPTVDSTQGYAVPDGTLYSSANRYKREIDLQLIDQNDNRIYLNKKTREEIEESEWFTDTTEEGTPQYYCIFNNEIRYYPIPDHSKNGGNAWNAEFTYYGFFDDLSLDTDTNYLTDYDPFLLIYAALARGFRLIYDESRADYYMQRAAERFAILERESWQEKWSEIDEGIKPVYGQSLGETGERYSKYNPYIEYFRYTGGGMI